MNQELDLTPDPRVLQMLGEINLHQWRCVAELVDNGIDALVEAARSGNPVESPEITITIPTSDKPNAQLVVRDNAAGMSIDTLEHAVRAGWTGNDPLTNLGLFGMGFNIATARLGGVTEVWTTRENDPEWVGVRIDLNELRTSRTFKVPRRTRPKLDHSTHGTEIIVSKLKPEQRQYLARSGNLATIRRHLARSYSSLLQASQAGRIRFKVNGTNLEPRRHCHWDPDREVKLPDGTEVNAVETFDVKLAPRRYCTSCMRTLASDEDACPTNAPECRVVERERRVRGWVGLQRYLHKSDFGIDFIRNGRKIEIGSKDLFAWTDGDSEEIEYPIDDPRNRGRFVGEVHMDHCRVSYTKDRFERDDPSWQEMVSIVRGQGPLRPLTAKQRGYAGNTSPLYKLFQAFRRSSPQGKNGLWSRILVVKDNDRAEQMAQSFHANDPDYIEDHAWWELVKEQDQAILGDPTGDGAEIPEGFLDEDGEEDEATVEGDYGQGDETDDGAASPDVERTMVHELSRTYTHPTYRVDYEVEAFATEADNPGLTANSPWTFGLSDVATRTYEFLFDAKHEVFRSSTMTPLDALLLELAVQTREFLRGELPDLTLANVISGFRGAYAVATRLDPSEIISQANATLDEFTKALPEIFPSDRAREFYDGLTVQDRSHIVRKVAARGGASIDEIVEEGRFWEFTDPHGARDMVRKHPEFFFDGNYWDDPYASLSFDDDVVEEEARQRVIARYEAYLVDAIWLASQSARDIELANRDVLIRATCSLRLLRPDVEG
ncbi:ATP-binding protein [Qipengyuania sp. XHP0211]|nr:ATP-binding protein [Qipengyuania sp. XHP0211]